jgi:hypothetical protein
VIKERRKIQISQSFLLAPDCLFVDELVVIINLLHFCTCRRRRRRRRISLGRILKILKKRFLQEGFCFVYHFSTRI